MAEMNRTLRGTDQQALTQITQAMIMEYHLSRLRTHLVVATALRIMQAIVLLKIVTEAREIAIVDPLAVKAAQRVVKGVQTTVIAAPVMSKVAMVIATEVQVTATEVQVTVMGAIKAAVVATERKNF